MNFEVMDVFDAAEEGTLDQFKRKFKREELNSKSKYGYSLLHMAIAGHNWDTVNFLLDEGIDINLKDKKGNTALHYMVDHMEFNYEEGIKVIKRLLDMEADVNEPDKNGTTPLMEATAKTAQKEGFESWKLFLQYNPDIYKENKDGRSCYSMAKEYCNPNTYNSPELWNYLVENGFIKDEEAK